MNTKLTVSIIGAGNIAGGFDEKKLEGNDGIFSHAGAYSKHGGFVLKTIFDTDKNRANEFKRYWSVEKIVDQEDDIINNFQDIISLCTPDKYHFDTIKKIILNNSCKTLFVEKPLGMNTKEVTEIYELSKNSNIKIIVNFQRHFDESYDLVKSKHYEVLTVNCYYIKGLNHIGITMIDTLVMLFGYPLSLYSYNRVLNTEIDEYSYEFILYYNDFNITVKTIDKQNYDYHIFDIDILTTGGRVVFSDNGQNIYNYGLSNYSYSGVKVLANEPKVTRTQYDISMLKSVEYLYNITANNRIHNVNTVEDTLNGHLVVESIVKSFKKNKQVKIEEKLWKK